MSYYWFGLPGKLSCVCYQSQDSSNFPWITSLESRVTEVRFFSAVSASSFQPGLIAFNSSVWETCKNVQLFTACSLFLELPALFLTLAPTPKLQLV